MTLLLVLGIVGVVLLLASLLLGDLFDGLFSPFDALEVDLDVGGLFSLPVFAAFLSAFGFGGALALSATDERLWAGVVGGVLAGVLLGWIAWRITRSLLHMATDATPTSGALLGTQGKVVTPLREHGLGEVLVRFGGQPVKLSARADQELAVGEPVVVVEVVSPTSVLVESASTFWSSGRLDPPQPPEAPEISEPPEPAAGKEPEQ